MTISGRKKVAPSVFEDTDIPLMARVNGIDNAPLVQADVATLKRTAYVKGTTPGTPDTLSPISSYVYNTLQTNDAAWDEDAIGYNVKDNLPNTVLSAEGTWYVDYEVVDTNGKKIAWGFEVNVVGR